MQKAIQHRDKPPLIAAPGARCVFPRAWSREAPGGLWTLIDPARETASGIIPMAGSADVRAATRSAREALAREGYDRDRRADLLAALIAEIEARHAAFADAISTEMGSPRDFAREKQVDAALDHLRVIRDALKSAEVEQQPDPARPGHWLRYEPLGVAALITPWNWPLNQVALKVGAALAAGCTMVLKPSELSSLSAILFAECMEAAGAADGIFSLLLGDGGVGAALVADPDVDVVSFTGSTAVGRRIASRAGADLKPVLLELGGKSANLLFADCDVERAVEQGMAHCLRNSGQSCNAASRMLVERAIYDRVVARAAEIAEAAVMDHPEKPGAHFGPLVNAAQFERVQDCIATATMQGARLVAGGPGRFAGLNTGYYPRPSVFADVTPEMALFSTEVFGPVLSISPFETEAEAIALANATDYGLAAYVQTGDPDRAVRVSRALDAGMVQVNGQSRAPGAPFGGRKNSGFGREAGLWGIRAFQSIKSVSGAG